MVSRDFGLRDLSATCRDLARKGRMREQRAMEACELLSDFLSFF